MEMELASELRLNEMQKEMEIQMEIIISIPFAFLSALILRLTPFYTLSKEEGSPTRETLTVIQHEQSSYTKRSTAMVEGFCPLIPKSEQDGYCIPATPPPVRTQTVNSTVAIFENLPNLSVA